MLHRQAQDEVDGRKGSGRWSHDGALAFLVVPKGLNGHKSDLDTDVKKPSFDMAEVAGPNPAEPIRIALLLIFVKFIAFV